MASTTGSNTKLQAALRLRVLRNDRIYWKFVAILVFVMLYMLYVKTSALPLPISIENTPKNSQKTSMLSTNVTSIKAEPEANIISAKDLLVETTQNTKEDQCGKFKIIGCPPSELPYNITPVTAADVEVKQMQDAVLKHLDGKQNGFFIECGAFDGVYLSNTLHLEQNYNWTGLLVEADPKYYSRLMTKQRKAWAINACLSIKPHEEKVRMTRIKNADALSIISEFAGNMYRNNPQAEDFEAQCFPLMSILSALGQALNIDYFSLDVEGAELKILKTVPWDFVYIKVISLEANAQRIGPIKEFLVTKNYEFFKSIQGTVINDHIFVHKQFIKERYALRKRSV